MLALCWALKGQREEGTGPACQVLRMSKESEVFNVGKECYRSSRLSRSRGCLRHSPEEVTDLSLKG